MSGMRGGQRPVRRHRIRKQMSEQNQEPPLSSPHPATVKRDDGTGSKLERVPWYRDPVVWFSIPGVGMLVDCLVPVTVPEELDRLLNMIALLDALMLGVLYSAVSAITFDEIQDALLRWTAIDDTSWSFCAKAGLLNKSLVEPAASFCDSVLQANGYALSYRATHQTDAKARGKGDAWDGSPLDGGGAIGIIAGELGESFVRAEYCFMASLMCSTMYYMVLNSTSMKDASGNFSYRMNVPGPTSGRIRRPSPWVLSPVTDPTLAPRSLPPLPPNVRLTGTHTHTHTHTGTTPPVSWTGRVRTIASLAAPAWSVWRAILTR